MPLGFRPLPLAGSAATPPPQGWWRPFEQIAPVTLLPVALVASGLIWCPQPIAASPVVTINTGWFPQTNTAPPTARAVHTQPSFVPNAFPQYPLGWHQALGTAPPVIKAQPGSTFVPFDTRQTNTSTIDKWQVPLSVPVPVAQAKLGDTFVPFNTVQINTTTIDKWQQPFVAAVKIAGPVHSQPSFVVPPFAVPSGWQSPLSRAPPTARAPVTDTPLPLYPVVAANNTVTVDKWQQPLSIPVPVAQARIGDTFVPFNTVQTVPGLVTYDKYQQPLSVAPPVARAVHTTVSFVALPFPQYPTGWHQPLSTAQPVAKSVFVDVPFVARDTAFTQNTVDIGKWLQPLGMPSRPAAAIPTQPTFVPLSFDIAKGWYSPLSVAVVVQSPIPPSSFWPPYLPPPAQIAGIAGMAWHVPLSAPVLQLSYSLFPFATWTPDELHTVPPPEPEIGVIQSGAGPAGKIVRKYRAYRFLSKKRIEEISAAEVREAATSLRAAAQDAPQETERRTAEMRDLANRLAYVARLEAAVDELRAAVAYAERKRQQDEDDDDDALLLTS